MAFLTPEMAAHRPSGKAEWSLTAEVTELCLEVGGEKRKERKEERKRESEGAL